MAALRPTQTDRPRVVVADDRVADRAAVVDSLGDHGFSVTETSTAERVLHLVSTSSPDAVVLDLRLPDRSGFDVLRELQARPHLVVVAVGESADELDCVTALELGADDYVARPVPPRELVARLRAALRRGRPVPVVPDLVRRFGAMEVDLPAKEVRLDGRTVSLTAREFELLSFMSAQPRRVFSREQLLEQVWGSRAEWQSLGTVSEHVRRIRRKLGCDPSTSRWIRTMRGAGYRFEPEVG
ncbi:MAG: response regulator transcription factor [Actinomycetes bacterium]